MFGWIKGMASSIGEWFGSGAASFADWLLGGLADVLTAIIDAAGGFWDVLDAIWDFALGFREDILALLTIFFPFVPAKVATVISLGLLAVIIAGIVKKRRA